MSYKKVDINKALIQWYKYDKYIENKRINIELENKKDVIKNNIKKNNEKIIKYTFKKSSLLEKALTLKSFDNNINNEKLEFFGDRV